MLVALKNLIDEVDKVIVVVVELTKSRKPNLPVKPRLMRHHKERQRFRVSRLELKFVFFPVL